MADLTSGEYLKDARQYSENDNLSDSQIINSYNAEFAPKEKLVMAEFDLEADGSGAMKGYDYTLSEYADGVRNENADLANVKDYQFRDAFNTYQQENNIKARGQRDSAFEYSTDVAAELLGTGITTLGDHFGWDDFRDYGNNIIRQQKQDLEDGQYTSANPNSLLDTYNNEGAQEFAAGVWTKMKENSAVSGMPLVAKVGAAALVGLQLPITAGILFTSAMIASAVMSIGESAQEQDDKTGESDSGLATATGLAVAASDYIGIGGSKFSVGDVVKDLTDKGYETAAKQMMAGLGRAVAQIGKRVAMEAVTETAQESLMMKAAQSQGGEYTSDEVKERLFDSAVLGGAMGGGISAPAVATQEISNNSQANRLREIRSVEREANLKSENEVEAIKIAVREMNARRVLGAEEQEVREKGASVRELAATLRGLTEQTNNTAKDNIEKGVTLSLDELAPGLDLETKKNKANEVVDRINEEEAKSDPKTDVESAFNARDIAIENEQNQRAPSEKDRINSQLAMMRLAVRSRQKGQPNRSNLPLLEKTDFEISDIQATDEPSNSMQNALRDAMVKKEIDEIKATPRLGYTTPGDAIPLSNDAIEQKKLNVLEERKRTEENSAIVGGLNEVKGAVIGGQDVPTRNLRFKTGNELFTKKGADLLALNLQAQQNGSDYTVVPIRRGQVTGFAIEITPTPTPTPRSVNVPVSNPVITAKTTTPETPTPPVAGDEIVPEETPGTQVEDPRLTDEDYIEYAKIMANELIVNGGMGYRTDDSDLGGGKIIGRTPSQNPDWFKNMLVEEEAEQLGIAPFKPSVKKIKEIAKKLSAGEKLTSKQDRATAQWMFNDIDFTREENIEDNLRYGREEEQRQLDELRENAIAAREAAVTPIAKTDIEVEDKKLPSDTPRTIPDDLQDVSKAQKVENETAKLNNETAKIKAKAEEQAILIAAQDKEVDETLRNLDEFTPYDPNNDIPFSKGNDVDGQTIEQAELVLREDKNLAKLIDDGKLEVNSTEQVTQQEQDQLFSEGETVQGLYRDGVATVFADNNNADTVRATAWHEVFHAAVDTLSPKVRKNLLDRLGKLSVDKKAQWVVDAMAAIPESTSEANRAEELGAYAVTQYTLENNNLPASVIKWAKDVISKIKASVYKNTGVLLGSLDPVMLKAIAKGWKGEGVSQDGSVKLSVASTVSGLSESLFSPETNADMKIKGEKARAFIKKITTKFFTKEGLAGKVAFQLKIIADGMKNASGSDMDFNTAIFGQLAAKEYGVKGFYDIDESTINDMQKYMTGTDAEKADSSLPVNIKEGLNDLRAYVDNRTEAVMEGLDKLWAVKISQLSEENQELVSEWRRSQDDPESFDGMEVDLPNIPGIKGLIDLKEILESNMGSYLNRSFQAFDDKKWAEKAKENTKLIEDASTFIRENDYRVNVEKALGSNFKAGGPVDRETKVLQGIKYIQDETFIPTGLSEKQIAGIDRRRGDLLSETNEDNEVLGAVYAILESARDRSKQGMAGLVANGTKYGTKDVSMFNKRKVIDGSILALLGEHRDPILNVARSVTKMDYFIANNEYLINLREQGLESGLFRERKSVSAKDGMEYTVQYASKTSDTLDPLNGLWTSPDVIEGLEDFNDSGGDGGWVDSFIRFNSKVKYGKTVLSSGTAFRNLFGGSFFPVLMGHNPFTGNFKEAFKESWADLYSKDEKFKDHIGKLTRLGVLHNSANASELKAILEDAMDMNEVGIINTNERALKYVPIGKIKRGAELAQNFYRMGDDLWKIVAFDKEVKDWMNVGYSEALAEKKAAYRIINGMPTYSMLPLGFRKLRRFPLVAPFVAFPYEVIRTVYNNYRFIQQDLKGVDENGKALDLNTEQLAKVKKLGNKRLIGMAIVHAAAPGLALLSRVLNGVDDEEDKTRRLLGPEWGRNSSMIYVGTDSNGNRVTLDSTYIMPYSIFTRAYNAIVNGTKEDLDDKIRDSLDELFSPFYNVDITAGAALEIVTNKKRAGGVVYNDQGSSYDIAGEVSNYALNKLAPGLFLNAERIYKGFDGQKNSTGQPYSKAGEVAAAFGFRFNTMDVSTAIRYHGYEIKDRLSNAQRILAKKASDRNEVSDLDLKQAFEDSMVARNAAYNEVIRIVTGVEKMGYSSAEVRQSLMGARFSQKDISSLMNYTIPRYKLTKQFLSSVVSTIDSSSASNSQKREDKKMFTDRKRYIQMLERDQDR